MKYILLLLILFFNSALAGNDPFDKKRRISDTHDNKQLNITSDSKCYSEQPTIFSETPFKQLKLVGIIFSSPKQVLMQDAEQNLTIAGINQLIAQEKYKIKTINKDSLILSRLDINCAEHSDISLIF